MIDLVAKRPTKTYEVMSEVGECVTAMPGLPAVSDSPIVTFGDFFCRSVVIYDGTMAGVIHLRPNEYPDEGIEEVTGRLCTQHIGLQAMLIESKGEYTTNLKQYLEEMGLAVVGHYTSECYTGEDGEVYTHQKDIITIPKSGEVRICIRDEVIVMKFKPKTPSGN